MNIKKDKSVNKVEIHLLMFLKALIREITSKVSFQFSVKKINFAKLRIWGCKYEFVFESLLNYSFDMNGPTEVGAWI